MKDFNQISFIKKIYYPRLSGTDGEEKAAETIINSVQSLGGQAFYEQFEFDSFEIESASLTVHTKGKSYTPEVTGYGRTGSTGNEGISAPFLYAGTGSDADLCSCNGKIVFVNSIHHDLYRRLIEKNALGFITFDGNVFDDRLKTDLNIRSVKEKTSKLGNLPGVTMRAADAVRLIKSNPETVCIKLKQKEIKIKSGNVVADIKGINEKEKMLFTAHYDSTRFSKGAWDNASGCANLMSLFSYYIKNRPRRSIRFIWCGAEEYGLKGSLAYVEAHRKELSEFMLGMNIDMTGTVIGNDIACVSGDDSLKYFLQYCANETAFPLSVSSGIFPSDSSSFANAGVPFVVFQRGGQGGMHSRNDIIDVLSETSLRRTTEFIQFASERLLNSAKFPVPRIIPDGIKDDLENYFS